jgi:hypothetical protein
MISVSFSSKLLSCIFIVSFTEDGRGMAKGFYQALFLTRSGPTLNINLTFACFYMPWNFVQFACKYLRKDITTGFTEQELRLFRQLVRDLISIFPIFISNL